MPTVRAADSPSPPLADSENSLDETSIVIDCKASSLSTGSCVDAVDGAEDEASEK